MARRGLLWLVLFALVTAQALGLMHRVAHSDGLARAPAAFAQHAGAGDTARAGGWLADLFAGHDDAGDCRLYDQVGQAGLIPVPPALPLPLLVPSFFLQWFQGECLARWAALFDARGPPPLR